MKVLKDLFLKLPDVKLSLALKMLGLCLLALLVALSLKPHLYYATQPTHFETSIPKSFAGWTEVLQSSPQVRMVSDERSLESQLYDDMLMRTYQDKEGHQVMLALAYAHQQRQDVKVHQPDVCYPAQGYQMQKSQTYSFDLIKSGAEVIGKRQLYAGQSHLEAVSYWIRVGDSTLTSGLQMRLKIIHDGLVYRRYDDEILVRVSSAIADDSALNQVYGLHEKFLKDLVDAMSASEPKLLVP
jgi:EpsI family protein